MFFRTGLVSFAAISFAVSCFSTSAHAANECASLPLKKRVACLEQKVDKMAASAVTPQSVQATVNSSLTNVKIDWAKHPGVYLWFSDFTQKTEKTPWSVNSDNAEYNTFNIHK